MTCILQLKAECGKNILNEDIYYMQIWKYRVLQIRDFELFFVSKIHSLVPYYKILNIACVYGIQSLLYKALTPNFKLGDIIK